MTNQYEPFNYDLCMERGGYAVTRDGRKVRLLCDDAPGGLPVVVLTPEVGVWFTDHAGCNWNGNPLIYTPPPEPESKHIERLSKAVNSMLHSCQEMTEALRGMTEITDEESAEADMEVLRNATVRVTDADYPEPEDEGRIVAVVPNEYGLDLTKGKLYKVWVHNHGRLCFQDDAGDLREVVALPDRYQPIYSNKTYAVTDYDGFPYITAGKVYEVLEEHGRCQQIFDTQDDMGIPMTCGWDVCMHITPHSWKRINGADYAED